jgi:hypothetical protein
VGIDRRVDDPLAPTGVDLIPPKPVTGVSVLSSRVLATSSNRLEVATRAVQSVAVEQGDAIRTTGFLAARSLGNIGGQAAIPVNVRQEALKVVDQDLVNEGLIDENGQISKAAQQELGWEKTMSIPTPGVLVKGCLDDCDTCEPQLEQLYELEIARKDLENQLLAKQIALLEKSQEYRCCPADEEETTTP